MGMLQGLPEHALAAGNRIFGDKRWAMIWKETMSAKTPIDQLGTMAVVVLRSSGYHDDPKDETRTLSNMETASMVYVRELAGHLQQWPVWVADKKSAYKPIGIEQIFDVVLEYNDDKKIRFAGDRKSVV